MIYNDITREWFTAIEADAEKQTGLAIDGDEGTVSGPTPLGDVTVQWVYDSLDSSLVIGVIHKPFMLLRSEVEKKLTALVESSKPAT
jgi:hypothetical protein